MSSLPLIRQWFTATITILSFLLVVYIVLHLLIPGAEIIKLSKQEITDINLILFGNNEVTRLSGSDSTGGNGTTASGAANAATNSLLPSDTIRRESVYNYIYAVRPPYSREDSINFRTYFNTYSLVQFAVVVPNYPIRVKSFFWLTEGGINRNGALFKINEGSIYLEIVFWSLFGLIANLLYRVSEALRIEGFKAEEISVHIAKFFYAPLCAIIIFLSFNALVSTGDISVVEFSHVTIVLAFILGFFSGRTIELLERVKELILPLNREKYEDGATGNEARGLKFEELDEEQQHQVIVKAIESNDEKWRSKLPHIQSIGSGKKYVDGRKTSSNAIVFTVNQKVKNIHYLDQIPPFVEYDNYHIPTDVQELRSPVTAQFRGPGSGVSRIDADDFGTIGLKVYRGAGSLKEYFIVSCYHVLCYKELNSRKYEITRSTQISSPEVVCPCKKDDSRVDTNIIAHVQEGKFTSYLDAAIARLRFESVVDARIGGITPSGIYDLKKTDEDNNFMVQTWGWVSKHKTGRVKRITDNPKILYDSPVGEKVMKELIQVEKISQEGDSGAPVFTMNGDVIGIIVGGDGATVSYILPIRTIMNGLAIQI